MAHSRTYIGADIGGTHMSVGLVSDRGELIQLIRMDTPRSAGADACLAELLPAATRLLTAEPAARPLAVGIGFGGPVDVARGVVRRSHHVAGWAGAELARAFSQATGLPSFLENDANAAALAEALFGAARGADVVLYVNVGTGIGGGIVIDGRIHRGAHFNAAEIGHIVLLPDGPPCPCGKRGCLEALASGDAIGRSARELKNSGGLARSALASQPNLTGRVVGQYACMGDGAAVELVRRAASYLGWALAIAANLIDPRVIVIGGGVAQLGDIYLQPAAQRYRELAMDYVRDVPIVPAALGYDAGVIGAAAVAMLALTTRRNEH